ncbi:hypothetical protein KC338_g6495 [Hortaea werneckii]|uniref:Uncharacterized protein n=1 Tax=Hortaea werneckii TaxID=91943 RepID=A0A3M7HYU0_HORWE|nr:hypothetical protein KC338_g6495 [Hortaea werneckii]KAI7684541.1 hypothetical protein KC322_g13356 [Hortaea werneckii]RMZ18417.1 hypothetical protein D0862_00318 [Hortaea werneckii]
MADRKRDPRFAALASDPRYRLPGKKESRTAVDPRFGRLFTDQEFRKKASVDRYGRKIKPEAGKKELEKLYRLDKDDSKPKSQGDKKAGKAEREVVGSDEESEEEGSEDAEEERVERKDPAREGGFSASESEEESSSEEESDEEADLAEDTAGQEQTEDIPLGEVTRRIAAVNMDWDNIRASDILAVAQSFLPGSGRVEKVTVFPSEFGRERLEKEELEGPPREIFASSARAQDDIEDEESGARSSDEEEDEDEKIRKQLLSNQADEGGEFDTAKLRQYQLERLRYYYAVIETDSKPAAKALYDSMDGREYLTTANFFDLRFIPDDVSFEEDTPKEECSKLPEGYKPNDFKTEALTHSKVRLTWDDDDTTRKEVQKRAFSRAEIDENDLQAYIGSDSSGEEDSAPRKETGTEKKASKREAERAKMRAALGLGEEPKKGGAKSTKEPVGEMEITFTSGLGGDKGGKSVFENGPQDEESTRERYIRKEKERKQKRKEKMKASRTGEAADTSGSDSEAAPEGGEGATNGQEDDGFNDPFFDDPSFNAAAEKKAKKAERLKKRAEKAANEEEAAARRKELELLMADDQADAVRHFDMREIEQQEKEAKRKGKKGRKGGKKGAADAGEEQAGAGAEEFKVDTEDPRFKGLFESHEYAIDPTNPRYKATQGMKALLEEGRKKRKRTGEEEEEEKPKQKGPKATKNDNGDELKGLVARLKGKGKR